MEMLRLVVVALAAMAAGAVNSVAGGGTVFNFSALVWYGLPVVRANATNATSLIPGSIGGAYALRRELRQQSRTLIILLTPTVLGSLLGAFTVANTSESIFRRVVPFLVLFATIIFANRNRITQWAKRNEAAPTPASDHHFSPLGYATGIALQFLISFYGGYFGAGIGILMLTSLSVMGMSNILKMNALKNALAVGINGTAMVFFILSNRVEWPIGLFAAVFAMIGGYGLASFARRVDQDKLRWGVVIAGVVVSAWMFVRLYFS
ncbi:MAG: sulfite exporter TauE/SafE family protein [Chloroflexi bacterium]|nr:sulfite exporter TauE/SafE family protein [Chloroflexota bacterium]